MMTGAYLGGHLSFVRGINVNHTAFEERPSEWTDVAADTGVGDGATMKVSAGGASVLLHRRTGRPPQPTYEARVTNGRIEIRATA